MHLENIVLGAIFLCMLIFSAHSHIINDLSLGFTRLPFNKTSYINNKPYNLPLKDRYSFNNGVHKLWVFSTDEPLYCGSTTNPRSELSINGYKYSSGVWQFEAHVFVPHGTSGVSLMQVFGAYPNATTLMVHVYDGNLYYYTKKIIYRDIYDKWFRLNVIHDVEGKSIEVYINGALKFKGHGRGGTIHYFKCGVYSQDRDSFYMESRWKNIKILEKCS